MPHFRRIKKLKALNQVPPPPIPQTFGEFESFNLYGMSGTGHEENKVVVILEVFFDCSFPLQNYTVTTPPRR